MRWRHLPGRANLPVSRARVEAARRWLAVARTAPQEIPTIPSDWWIGRMNFVECTRFWSCSVAEAKYGALCPCRRLALERYVLDCLVRPVSEWGLVFPLGSLVEDDLPGMARTS